MTAFSELIKKIFNSYKNKCELAEGQIKLSTILHTGIFTRSNVLNTGTSSIYVATSDVATYAIIKFDFAVDKCVAFYTSLVILMF